MATSVNEDSVRIQISKTEGEGGSPAPSLQTTIGGSSANPTQASNFLQAQLGALSNKSITLFRRQLTYRELIFIGIAVILGATSIGLMAVVVVSDQTLAYERSMATCTDIDCYTSASAVQRKTNVTAYDPCNNFYQYACNGWVRKQSLFANEDSRSILSELEVENLERLNGAIMTEVDPLRQTDWAYEGKVQKLYKTCLDQYQMTQYYDKSNPVVAEIAKMGGWYVFNNVDISKFKWTVAHRETLGRDNLVDVFFYYDIEPWDQQHSTYLVTLKEDPLPLPFNKWEIIPGYQDFQSSYRQMLTQIATMMAADANVKDAQLSTRISNFVDDVITVEKALADAQKANAAELEHNSVLLQLLGTLDPLGAFLDGYSWIDYFNTTLMESSKTIAFNTRIAQWTPKTLAAVTKATRNFNKQQFNNYLAWRLIYAWLPDMSYEYNHIWLKWEATKQGNSGEYKPNWTFCLERTRLYMPDALDGVFVRRHFNNLDKDEITYISESLRTSVANEILKLDWMDDDTRKIASEKVSKVIEKLGYPDYLYTELSAQNALDYSYMLVNMSETNYFQNAQQLRQHFRRELCNIYSLGRDPLSDWRKTPLYSVYSSYFYPWNEMVVPAGLLQFPIFSGYNPSMYRMQTFASAGLRLARGYLFAITETGQYFDKNGNQLSKSWYSADTTKLYNDRKQCFTDWYTKVETDPIIYQGQKQKFHLTYPDLYAAQAIIDIGSLRNSFTAYTSEKVQSDPKTASELYLPGAPAKSLNEYFFLSFAQSMCAIRTDDNIAQRMKSSATWLPEELMVNNVLMHMPEFSSVFSCPAGSKMNPQPGCNVY